MKLPRRALENLTSPPLKAERTDRYSKQEKKTKPSETVSRMTIPGSPLRGGDHRGDPQLSKPVVVVYQAPVAASPQRRSRPVLCKAPDTVRGRTFGPSDSCHAGGRACKRSPRPLSRDLSGRSPLRFSHPGSLEGSRRGNCVSPGTYGVAGSRLHQE